MCRAGYTPAMLPRRTGIQDGTASPLWPLIHLLLVIRKRLWIIVMTAMVTTGVVVGFSLLQPPRFEASVKVLVGQERATDDDAIDVFDLQQLTQTVNELALTRPISETVVRRLNLTTSPEALRDSLEVQQIDVTQFIQIDYTDTNPARAQRVANTTGEVLSEQISEINATGNVSLSATVAERATLPDEPSSPHPIRNGALALVAGSLLGMTLALLLDSLDGSWRSPEELEQFSAKPNLGVIPRATIPKAKASKSRRQKNTKGTDDQPFHESMVTLLDPAGTAAEAYRTVRTNLLFSFVDESLKVIVVSSAISGEGKSTVCANLGMTLAEAGKSTLLLDCDLRKPNMHNVLGLRNVFGLVDVLAGHRNLREVLHELPAGPKVITSGTVPPNALNLLGSERFAKLLAQVRQEFDYVLLDSPPIKGGSDAAILAHRGDGMLFVVDAQNTRRWVLQGSLRSLERTGVNVLGTIMNKVEPSQGDEYLYGYA
jgi:capsular exopolysaccharide synthesis family protein